MNPTPNRKRVAGNPPPTVCAPVLDPTKDARPCSQIATLFAKRNRHVTVSFDGMLHGLGLVDFLHIHVVSCIYKYLAKARRIETYTAIACAPNGPNQNNFAALAMLVVGANRDRA